MYIDHTLLLEYIVLSDKVKHITFITNLQKLHIMFKTFKSSICWVLNYVDLKKWPGKSILWFSLNNLVYEEVSRSAWRWRTLDGDLLRPNSAVPEWETGPRIAAFLSFYQDNPGFISLIFKDFPWNQRDFMPAFVLNWISRE